MNKKTVVKKLFCTCACIAAFTTQGWATDIKGKIVDRKGQPIIGVTVKVEGSQQGAVTDMDGNYSILNVKGGKCNLIISYVGYKTVKQADVNVKGDVVEVNTTMEEDVHNLGGVTVVGQAKRNTINASVNQLKTSLLVESNISAQQISRTQDKDASEVIRRVPGISIIDGKFVMVRGLAQRYNNVWVNGAAVPSSEPDTRAFSFDIIPSTQLDNINIIKSPAPEYPADFSGGFILIKTKDLPSRNSFNISLGTSVNTQTHFRDSWYSKGSDTDWLGFDNGFRSFNGGIKAPLKHFGNDPKKLIDLNSNGFNNNWNTQKRTPVGDLKLNMDFSHRWIYDNGVAFGMIGTLNYSNTYKSYLNMLNAAYQTFPSNGSSPRAVYEGIDNQYNNDVRWGTMLNFMLRSKSGKNYYEFKNIFNQNGSSRLTKRTKGIDDENNNFNSTEYYYTSRSTLASQITGRHMLNTGKLDWSVGYAYSNRNMPDRRIYKIDDSVSRDPAILQFAQTGRSNLSRYFSYLKEHMASGNLNYELRFNIGNITPTMKTGLYAQYRNRSFDTRQFSYLFNNSGNLPSQYLNMTIDQLMNPNNYGEGKLTLNDETKQSDNYKGHTELESGYWGINIPFTSQFSAYAGIRYEHYQMVLTSIDNVSLKEQDNKYTYNDLFPSINLLYKFNEQHQIRLSYGKSTDRPEFREVAPSMFQDFDLGGQWIGGNSGLKPAYIHNLDFRYEFYPHKGETISIALFYKHFKNPIEWSYTVQGGTTYTYQNMNAQSADNYGAELDIRKNLDFMSIKDISWVFNAAWIKSKVNFNKNSATEDRPMEGQSPYLINTGFFYEGTTNGWSASLLYNRIGKRITGVGRIVQGDLKVPNSYEMPHDTIDILIGKKFGHMEVKFGIKDLLGQTIKFEQIYKVSDYTAYTRKYKPGQTFNLSLSYAF